MGEVGWSRIFHNLEVQYCLDVPDQTKVERFDQRYLSAHHERKLTFHDTSMIDDSEIRDHHFHLYCSRPSDTSQSIRRVNQRDGEAWQANMLYDI